MGKGFRADFDWYHSRLFCPEKDARVLQGPSAQRSQASALQGVRRHGRTERRGKAEQRRKAAVHEKTKWHGKSGAFPSVRRAADLRSRDAYGSDKLAPRGHEGDSDS